MLFYAVCIASWYGYRRNIWLVCVYMHWLTAVDSLEAKVISKFPFMPNTAGTRMKISVTSRNTSQFCNIQQKIQLTKCNRQQHKHRVNHPPFQGYVIPLKFQLGFPKGLCSLRPIVIVLYLSFLSCP